MADRKASFRSISISIANMEILDSTCRSVKAPLILAAYRRWCEETGRQPTVWERFGSKEWDAMMAEMPAEWVEKIFVEQNPGHIPKPLVWGLMGRDGVFTPLSELAAMKSDDPIIVDNSP